MKSMITGGWGRPTVFQILYVLKIGGQWVRNSTPYSCINNMAKGPEKQ